MWSAADRSRDELPAANMTAVTNQRRCCRGGSSVDWLAWADVNPAAESSFEARSAAVGPRPRPGNALALVCRGAECGRRGFSGDARETNLLLSRA